MKLIKADIDGFGQLHAKQIPLDASLIVVYGPNEAGKSTIFGFIRSMLYGFAKRGQAVERQDPVNGGKHGGRLFFGDQAGENYVLERYSAEGTGKLRLRGLAADSAEAETSGTGGLDQGALLTQEEWEKRYLGGITERLYRQLFAITLSELQEIGALSGDELSRYLYQAGWDSGKSVAAAEKKLMLEMETLFKPRGSNQQINQQLKSLEQIEGELRQRADAIGAFNELSYESDQIELSLRRLEVELPLKAARHKLLQKACNVRPLWIRKRQLLLERQTVSYSSRLSAQAAKRWEELQRQREAAREEAEQCRQKALLLELQLEAVHYDDELIQLADETEALLQKAESVRKLQLDEAELEAELREHDEAVARLVGSIAPEWTERQLRELQVTVADRDYVRTERQREADRARAEERFAAELVSLRQQEREAEAALDEAEAAVRRESALRGQAAAGGFAVVPGTQEALKGAWNALDAALREWELERVRAASAADGGKAGSGAAGAGRGGAGPLWAAAAGAGGAALALGAAALSGAAAGKAAGGAGLAALALAVAALALAAAALARRRSGGSSAARAASGGGRAARGGAYAAGGERIAGRAAMHESEQRVRRALEAIVREPAEAAAALLAAKHHDSAEHLLAAEQARTQLRAAVEKQLEAMQTADRLESSRGELARRLDRLRALVRERSEAAAAAAQEGQAAARQWAGWLAGRSLPETMSPAAALEAFELAGQALQRLHQYDRMTAKLAAVRKQIAAFGEQAAALCGRFEEADRQLAADPALALRLLQAETRRHAAAKQEAHGIEARRAEITLAMQAAEARLRVLAAAVQAELDAAGMESESQHQTALGHRQQLDLLDLELSKLELEITAGMSDGRIAELEELFADNDEEQLQWLQAQAQAELERLEDRKREQLEQRGRLRQSMEHLLKEEEQRRLLDRKEMTVARLKADAERYAVLAVSAALIRRTKRIYEEERQPIVLKSASRLIAGLTDGKYIRVLAAPGEPGIRLETGDRKIIDSAMLSRGTAELVYLAMRFALAEEASQSVKLPLLLDDVFVNFDGGRLQASARLAAELSKERQIIMMTCHKHIRDALLAHCEGAAFVQI
ncbi:AAA family ATPase [Paenibacillus harenae]|uniref:AAA family ATPase n=1 Tax=Paenibacillus harenae TaxID=306543 RepID=UPI000401D5C7|nr:AAA family ATPase [Paenibacillus harenae]